MRNRIQHLLNTPINVKTMTYSFCTFLNSRNLNIVYFIDEKTLLLQKSVSIRY